MVGVSDMDVDQSVVDAAVRCEPTRDLTNAERYAVVKAWEAKGWTLATIGLQLGVTANRVKKILRDPRFTGVPSKAKCRRPPRQVRH